MKDVHGYDEEITFNPSIVIFETFQSYRLYLEPEHPKYPKWSNL